MTWFDVMKLDIGIYNECCDKAKEMWKKNRKLVALADKDCIEFRRVLEQIMPIEGKPVLDMWDKCLEDNNEPPIDTLADLNSCRSLEEKREELSGLMGATKHVMV